MKIPMPTRVRRWIETSPWLNRPTTRRAFLLPYLLLALALIGGLVLLSGQSQIRSDAQSQALAQQADLITVQQYVIDSNTFSACVSKSIARDDLIQAIDGIYDLLDAIAVVVQAPAAIVAQITTERTKFDTSYMAIDIKTCGNPPVFPRTTTP